VSHVLGKFSAADRPVLETVLAEVEAGIDLIRRLGLERAANRLNSFRPDLPPS
jgi:PTH1 family peptidyl-tRNA hydrolase